MKTNRSAIPAPMKLWGVLFLLLLLAGAAANLLFPGPDLLEMENRMAEAWQTPTPQTLLSGEWMASAQAWTQDHVPLRQPMINAACLIDEAVFRQVEKNGILIGRDGWLFTQRFAWTEADEKQLKKNIDAVNAFSREHPGLVTLMVAPPADVIYPEALPAHAPQIDENAILDRIFDAVSETASVVDLRDVYSARRGESLYYHTDHHWTTLGAWYAYEAFCRLRGREAVALDAELATPVGGFLGTHYASARLWNAVPDTLVYYPQSAQMQICEIRGELDYAPGPAQPLVNPEKLLQYDKYAAFLDGNNGLTHIEGSGKGRILVVKDSYGNCFVPHLTATYADIDVIDYRGFPYGLASLAAQNEYDDVLILYCFQSFVSDPHLVFMNRPTTLPVN